MIDAGGSFWTILLGSNATVALITGMISRKRDVGELSNDFARNLMSRLERVEGEKDECDRRTTALEQQFGSHNVVLRLAIPELQRAAPYSSALDQCRASRLRRGAGL